jgi:hypothetical protein
MLSAVLWAIAIGITTAPRAAAQSTNPDSSGPYIVEWVYRVKWGYQDEFNSIFKKYQIAILNKAREAGYVEKYIVQRPGLHTSEDQRWDLRVLIYYKSQAAQLQARGIAGKLFPDQETFRKEENRRWELTLVHWDLPIREVDPNASR